MFLKIVVLKNFAKLTVKQLCQSLFCNEVAVLRCKYFSVNFEKILRAPPVGGFGNQRLLKADWLS